MLIAALIFIIGAAIIGVVISLNGSAHSLERETPYGTFSADGISSADGENKTLEKTSLPQGQRSLENASVILERLDFFYTGSQIRPDEDEGLLSVALDGLELVKNVDYTVSASGNVDAGRLGASLTVSGIGDFVGERSVAFSIVPAQVTVLSSPAEDGDLLLVWNDVFGADGYQLECSLDRDFEEGRCFYEQSETASFDFTDNIEAGEKLFVRVRAFILTENAAAADDPDELRVYGEFSEISELSAKKVLYSMRLSDSGFVFSGNEIRPGVTVYSGKGEKLTENADYTLSFVNNSAPGVATALVTGAGEYSGELSADFVIKPKKNSLSIAGVSAGKISVSWIADPDCDGYIILYSTDPGFSKWDYYTTYDVSETSATIDTASSGEVRWYLKLSAFVVTNRERGSWKGVYSEVISAVVNSADPDPGPPVNTGAAPIPTSPPVSALPPASAAPSVNTDPAPAVNVGLEKLRSLLTEQISEYSGSWSVYVRSLRTDEELVINNRKYFPASLMKLFVMAAAYQAVEDGKASEEALLPNLTEMITVSSNSASNLLLGQIGYTAPKEWIESNGYTDTYFCRGFLSGANYNNTVIAPGDNYSTVADIGRLMVGIYKGTCVSQSASARMEELLKKQKRVSKIPAGVPDGVATANKTGEVSKNTHDCAIVYLDGNPYVLCVMTEFPDSAQSWDGKVAEISGTVFNYMKNLA